MSGLTGRRAFASKLIKDSNVDIRNRLAKILSSSSSSVNNNEDTFPGFDKSLIPSVIGEESPVISNYYCDTSINDLIDPIDYEDYLANHSDRIAENLRPVLLFPSDDIVVEKYQPPLRTLEPSSTPEFNNLKTSEDPYIQCIGSCSLKSLIVVKKYEKNLGTFDAKLERNERCKYWEPQEYEVDLKSTAKKRNSESISVIEAETPNTIYSLQTSTKNTPRPQSLISSTSTTIMRPPLASDEDDCIEDEDENSRTPLAQDCNQPLDSCDNSSLKSFSKETALNNNRNSWTYIDAERPEENVESERKDLFSLKNAQSDLHIQGILEKNYDKFFNELNPHYVITDNEKMLPIFCLYPFPSDEELIEYRQLVSPPSDVHRFKFLVKCHSLEMDLSIEPIFASIAIYDAKARKKVTENFYFDLNSESMKHLLQPHISYQDLSTLSKSAIFGLSQLNPDMYFVIKLEKVFQSDISDFIDAYSRVPEDQNKIDKLKGTVKTNCERLGRYRMFFAWAVFPLADILCNNFNNSNSLDNQLNGDSMNNRNSSNSLDSLKRIANECTSSFVRKGSLERHLTLSSNLSSNSLSSNSYINEKKVSTTPDDMVLAFNHFQPVTITNKIFYRHDGEKFSDDDLYKFLMEFRRSTLNTKRIRSFPCTLKLSINSVIDESSIKCRVNPELVKLHPYINDRISPTKEILEFRDLLIPHIEHRNLLYVYPKSVNFTSRQKSARNVTVKVQLFSEEKISETMSGLPVIFGKSSCPEYLSETFTAINYHNRSPNFSDEFKIRLPSQINKQTHLFFSFIHVHTKPKTDVSLDEIVGYSWLPLWRDDCLQTGTFFLPILSEMPSSGYSFLTPTDSDSLVNLKWIDNHKPLFVVHIESYSSIFAQDSYVDRFFRMSSNLEANCYLLEEFSKAISDLTNSKTESLIKFVHIIFNRLMMMIVNPPAIVNNSQTKSIEMKTFKTLIFETLVSLINKINKYLYNDDINMMKVGILSTFFHYQAILPQPDFNLNSDQRYSSDSSINSINDDYTKAKTFHEEIVQQWLSSKESICEKIYEHSFIYFDMIFKSLCISVSLNSNRKTVPRNDIDKSFKNNIKNLVSMTGDYIVNKIKIVFPINSSTPTTQTPQSPVPSTNPFCSINSSLAYFIRDLVSILDRHYVFSLIKLYLTKMNGLPMNNFANGRKTGYNSSNNHARLNDELFELKVSFLRIICGHEHFVALNLPFGTPLFNALEQSSQNTNPKFSPSFSLAKEMLDSNIFSNLMFDRIRPYSELTDEYRRQHWLLGLVFCILLESFTKVESCLQTRAANLIRSILTTFDWDVRFKDATIKRRTACLFLPLIGIMIDVIDKLHDSCTKENSFYSALESRKNRKLNGKIHREDNSFGSTFIESSIAMAIGTSSINGLNDKCTSPTKATSPLNYRHILSYQPINEEATRILLACFLWTIGNVDHHLFIQYLNEFSNERLLAFLELLRISMRVFEYQGSKVQRKCSHKKLEETIRYGTARRELIRRRDHSQSFGPTDSNSDLKLRWKRDSNIFRNNSMRESPKRNYEEELKFEGHLCTMMNLIILDSIVLIVNIFRQRIKCNSSFTNSSTTSNSTSFSLKNKYANDEFVVASALHALLQLFSFKQSTRVLESVFDTQRALLHHFPELLFIEGLPDIEFCSELCYLLLKHCASQIGAIRAQASASIYLLLRQYFESTGNYSRIKIQITMSLSQLVGENLTYNEINIKNSLNSILLYAINDNTVRETQFPDQVQELVFNLIMILSDTMQMKKHEKDPEMLLDLMYRIAKGYQNSPELRITWLENMAKKHSELNQHVEAAQCYVHAAALISECLRKIFRSSYLPMSCTAFRKICPNVFEESLNCDSEINIDKTNFFKDDMEAKNGLQSLKISETDFITIMQHAAECFQISGMFEAVNEVYKLLIPIHETHYRYKELAQIHGRLQDVFNKIEQQEGKRVFATYFRVGFYGSRFGDLNKKEFVYKERFLTKLPEIANRLETFYGNCLGPDNVEVIKDSNLVDITKLNPAKAYIQITYVEPYWDAWELKSRQTCYERNYNINRFIYSTPFTMDGRAHGHLYEQCKRKTILTVEHYFPYVKTRIQVESRQQHSLSPIEVAIEDLQKKTNELNNAIHQEPVDAKILQMVLQGCVGTTVNQGPAEIAFVFLSDEPNIPDGYQRPNLQLKEKLRNAFNDFCARCGEALTKNRKLVNGNEQQIEYHKELVRNFNLFTERLAPLMGHSNTKQLIGKLRKTYIEGFSQITMGPNSADNSPSKVYNGVGRIKHV